MAMVKQITGRHVLIWLLSAFGVVFTVNGFFLYVAISGFPGLDTEDGYRKGLAYNDQISDARTIRELGWRVELTLGKDRVLEVNFDDRNGDGLAVRDVRVILAHPANASADRELVLSNPAPGRYVSAIDDQAQGKWIVKIAAVGPDARRIKKREKLWLE